MEFKYLGSIILFVAALLVILSFFPSNINDSTRSGVSAFKFAQCEDKDTFGVLELSTCNVVNCNEEGTCDEEQEGLWKQQLLYLDGKDCSNPEKECSDFEEEIWECEKDSTSESCSKYDNSIQFSNPNYNPISTEEAIEILRDVDFEKITDGNEVLARNLKTIIIVETRGEPIDKEGKVTLRFECHIFNDIKTNNCDNIRKPSYEKVDCDIDFGETFSRESTHTNRLAFENAMTIDKDLAICSTSFGLGQIMGFNYNLVGFNSYEDFYNEFEGSNAQTQVEIMYKFIDALNLNFELSKEEPDWNYVAEKYNGRDYRKNNYAVKLSQVSNELKELYS